MEQPNLFTPKKMYFGLQPKHIERIESELNRFDEIQTGDLVPSEGRSKFIRYVWEKLGAEFGWDAFTLALYYFKHLENKNRQ